MSAITFDTLASVQRMREKGISQEHAEAIAVELRTANELDISHLSTKEEFAIFKSELKSDLKALESGFFAKISETNAKISETNVKVSETKAELIKWFFGAMIAQTAIIITVFKLLH